MLKGCFRDSSIESSDAALADSREDGLGVLESPFQDSGTLQLGKEKLSSSNSEELHVSKNMTLAERNKQAQRRHRQRQRVHYSSTY